MAHDWHSAIDRLAGRDRASTAEIQAVLEDTEAPDTAFDEAIEQLNEQGLPVDDLELDPVDRDAVDSDAADLAAVSDSVGAYLRALGNAPLLNAEEEVALGRRIQAGRRAAAQLDLDATNSPMTEQPLQRLVAEGQNAQKCLVESNLRLVVSIAKRYAGPNAPLLDLVQEGNLGLMRAVEGFDPEKGFRFSTYACWWIRHAISGAVNDHGRAIRLPANIARALGRLSRTRRRLRQRLGREPTVLELDAECALDSQRLEALGRLTKATLSLQSPIGEGESDTLADRIEDVDGVLPSDALAAKLLRQYLERLLDDLDTREREIVVLRFGLADGEPLTREEIGRRFGLSPERIRQLEIRAMRKLRNPRRSSWLADF